jgi:uncharacterized RDD family membrane protein YckC
MQVDLATIEYATFWDRFLASILDSIVQLLVLVPLALLLLDSGELMGQEFSVTAIVINYVLPALYVLLFWKYRSATPGKLWMGIMIIDAKTGGVPGMGKFVLRYIGYFVCVLTLFLGFLMILVDNRKRGLHDVIAGTLVIRTSMSMQREQEQESPDPQQSRHFMDR